MPEIHNDTDIQQLPDLLSYQTLNAEPEKDFDGILEIASAISGSDATFITLAENGKLWLKAKSADTLELITSELTFCGLTISTGAPLFVNDTLADPRFCDNEFVTGEPYIRSYAGFPLISAQGLVLGTISVLDFSPRVFTENQKKSLSVLARQVVRILDLRKKNELLELLNKRVETKSNSLKQLVQHQEKVMAILGHDTRGPLVFIKDILNLIKGNQISAKEAEELFTLMDSQIGVTLSLIENLTNWGVAGIEENNKEPLFTDLHDLVEGAFLPYKQASSRKGVEFYNQIRPNQCKTRHTETLTFIIRNLLNNAVKYTEEGSITVSGRVKKKCFEILVADTGIGIPQSMLNYLFITKFDSRCGTRGEQGSGLGLMLIFDFVEKLNGYIDATSTEGDGTTFVVGIPLEE